MYSTIFKTVYGDLGNWTTRFSVLGKSINGIQESIKSIYKDVSSGDKNFGTSLKEQLFPSKESIKDKLVDIDAELPKLDTAGAQDVLNLIANIEAKTQDSRKAFQQLYDTGIKQNQWIAEYAMSTKESLRSTDGIIAANKKARDSAIMYNNTLRQTTLGAKVTTLALKGLALAGNILAGIAISAVVSGVFEMIQTSSKVAEKASELGDQFDTTAESVEQYKKKIDELKATIADSGSSIEEVTNARQGLLDLQNEMIEKYGTEKSVIDTVTESINDQTSALDKLTDNAWRKAKNEFNDTSFWSGLSNFFQGYDTNVDRMMDEYGKHSAKINLNQYADFTKDGEQLDEFIRLAQSLGGKLTVSDAEGSFIEFNGVASDVENTLIRIQGIAENLQLSSKFQKHIGDLAKDAEDLADKYKTFYDQYILQEKVLSQSGEDNGYAEVYKNLLDQKKKIDEAYTSGDDAAREDAIKEYANILSAAFEANGDNDVTQWLRSMYPDIQGEVSKWVFKLNFEANKDGLKDNLEEYIKTFTGKGYAAEDIIDYDPAKSNDVDLESAYRSINQALEGTGLELKDIIPLFEELNLVQSRAQQLLSKKFGKDQVAKLSPEDLEIVKGFSQDAIDSMESWDDLIKKIEEAKLAAQNAAAEISSARKLKDINADKSGIDGLFSKYENAEGQLSQDDVASILEANPEYIQYLIKVGDQYKLNKQALEDWNAVNKEQELAIDNQMGGNKYLESYDSVLSDIANPASHGNGDGVGGTGISEQLDDLIAKNKELNNSFLNGEITASEYFSNLSGYITSSGLEDALHSLNGKFDDTTDYIEETVSVLSTELSDALLQSNKRFLKGETSVSQYIDELQAGTDAQKKLLSSTYNLKANSSGLVEITDDMSESTKNAAESYNDLVKSQSGLEGASGLADVLQENADFLSQYTDEAGNLMDSIFQDNQFDSYVSSMSDQIATFAQSSIENMSSTAEWLSETAGISLQEATDIVSQGGGAIQETVGNSLTAVGSMSSFAMQSIGGAVSNASTAIGGVLSALGEMISSFNYKIEAHATVTTPPHISKGENGLPELDLGTYGLEFTGSGGESVKDFSTALTNAGSYFTKTGTEQANARIMDLNSYKSNNNSNTAGGYRPTYKGKSGGSGGGKGGSGSGSGSEKDPTEFDWIERKHKLMEETMSKLKEQSSDTSLRYTGLDNDTINRALALFDQIHNQVTISTDDFSWLAQAASSAGMSLDEFFLHLQDGGGVSRMSALQEILERDKKDLETYTQDAQTYSSMYEEAVSKLTPEYREKIEHGGNDVEELPDKENEAVQKAVKLYDKKKEAEQKVTDTQKQMHETQVSMYDIELEELEKQNDEIEGRNSLITKQIDYLNTSGRLVNGTAYETLIANLGKQKSIIEQELEVKKRELAEMMESNPDYKNSQEYYDLQKSISDSELSLIDLTNQQAEYNDILRQLPVNNMQKLVDMYNNISTAMENWKNEIESAGKSVGADYYQEQIKNGQATIRQLQEQRSAVADVMDEYETGSDKWAEMNSKLTDIDSSISSIIVNMNEWNEAMLQIPIDKMEKLVSDLQMVKDALDDVNSEHQTVISAVTGAIDDQRKAWEEAQKAETDATQNKIDAIQDQLDLLDKQNEALDLQVAKEQALKKLEDAKTQKKTRVIRDGQIVYEADQDAIRDATDSLQDAETNLKKHELQTEKEKLEDELDVINDKYDKLYDKLDKIANKWEKIQPDREQLGNEKVADRYLGDDWINKVLSGNDDDIYSAFKELYDQNVDSQEQYEDQIKSTEQIQTLVNTYIEAYRSGTLTRDQAMTGIRGVLASVNHEITAGDNVNNILNYLSTQNSTGATTNDILTATQNQLSSTSKDIMQSLDVYEKNSNTITGYMSSFGELTTDVATMRSTINDVDDNLDSINSTLKAGFDDVVEALDSWRSRQEDDDDDDEKNGVHSTNHAGSNGWQSSDKFDGGNGKQGYEVGWTRKYANGIEEGIIGNVGDKEKYMAIREMATTDLKPSEQPILAHTGEIVLNPEQQAQLLKNIQQSTMTFKPETLSLKPVNVPTLKNNTSQNIVMNFGDLSFPDVKDVDGFAKAVARDFPGLMRQAMSKTR